VLVADGLLDLRPINPERRIRDAVVKPLAPMAVLGQGVPVHDVAGVLTLDEHVGEADRVGLRVQLLPVQPHNRARVVAVDLALSLRQHPARPAGAVEHAPDRAWLA
jgi:hypothetical protein